MLKPVSISNIYILFVLIGSQLIGVLSSVARIDTQILLWGNYMVTAGLAVHIILQGVARNNKMFNVGWAFWCFLSIYIFRMYVDLYINNVYTSTFPSPHTYFIYLLGICLLCSVAIQYCKDIDFAFISKWFFILLFFVIVLSILYNSVLGLDSSSTMRNAGAENIGALTYGHLGVSFFLMSLHFFLVNKLWGRRLFFCLCMAIGLVVMYLASSRSPLLALVLCTAVYLLIYRGAFRGLIIFSLLLLPIYFFWDDITASLSILHGDFIMRVMMAIESGDTSGRDIIYEYGFNQFLEYPVLGGSFLIENGEFKGFYPHNLFLEMLMATGVVGAFFFFVWLFKILKSGFILIQTKNSYAWIPVLFLQYLIFNMASKSLYTNSYLWYFAFLVLYLTASLNKKKLL